jgi:hypothetical protein
VCPQRRDGQRTLAFSKRLLETAAQGPPALVAGALFLVSEVMKTKPDLLPAVTAFAKADEGEGYDPMKREPCFAFQEGVQPHLWELWMLRWVSPINIPG